MATAGPKEVICSLVKDGTLELEHKKEANFHPYYRGLVVSGDMIIVADGNACNVQLHRLQDGKLLATSDRLESGPRGIHFINDMEICVILWNKIEIMSVQCTGDTGVITQVRTVDVSTAFYSCHAAVKFMDKVIVCGRKRGMGIWKQDTICWCIVSLQDGHVGAIHQICKGGWRSVISDRGIYSHLTTKDSMIYISCDADYDSPETGVYGYDIQNPSKQKFIYKDNDLKSPRGITVDMLGFIFVCNKDWPTCIHHLTNNCELVTIYREEIPSSPWAICWDQHQGYLYVTSMYSNVITLYKPVYPDQQGPIIPMEIFRMDEKSIQLYKEALRDGKEKVYNIRVMVVGQYGVGKTTLTKRLLEQQVDLSERKSTEGIDVYKHCCKVSLETGEWIVQHEDSDQLSRLQRLVKILTGQTKRPEVSGDEDGHREVIYQRETTPNVCYSVSAENDNYYNDDNYDNDDNYYDDDNYYNDNDDNDYNDDNYYDDDNYYNYDNDDNYYSDYNDDNYDNDDNDYNDYNYDDCVNDDNDNNDDNCVNDDNYDNDNNDDNCVNDDNDNNDDNCVNDDNDEIYENDDNYQNDDNYDNDNDDNCVNDDNYYSDNNDDNCVSDDNDNNDDNCVNDDNDDNCVNADNGNNDDNCVNDDNDEIYENDDNYQNDDNYDNDNNDDNCVNDDNYYSDNNDDNCVNDDNYDNDNNDDNCVNDDNDEMYENDDNYQNDDNYENDDNYYNDDDEVDNDDNDDDRVDDGDDIPTSSEPGIDQKVDMMSTQLEKSDQRHVTSKGDATMKFLQLVSENADRLKKSMGEYAALAMWDFAGQYVFYTTHQTFLTCRAIYLLVTDLSKQVTDLVRDDECYFDTEGARLCEVQDLVEVWLNSIHCCAPSSAAGTIVASPSVTSITAGNPVTFPTAGISLTSPASVITVTSSAAGTPITSTASGITVISPTSGMKVIFPASDIAVISPASGIIVTSPASGITVTSSASGITVTSPASGTTLTSPASDITVKTPAAGTAVKFPEDGTALTSSKPDTTVMSPQPGTTVTSSAADIALTSPAVGITVTPPVILVGTHADKIQEDKRQEVIDMYFQQICRILKDKPTLHHLVDFLAIDNTHLDPQLKTLKDMIFQLASVQPYWGEEVPTSWLPLEEALMKLKASGQKVIPLSLVEELNQASSVPIKSAEQLDLFLRFQHELGTILYFSIEGLREKIVLDPQWLIDALKSLITAEMFILRKYPTIRDKWFEFKDNGKLTPELIDAIWTKENNPELHDNKKHILLLMEKLSIIARPRSNIEDGEELKEENYFLAPCMLRQKTPVDVICPEPHPQMESSSVLCYVFTEKFLPSPIFHRLLAACVAHWPIATQKKENLIFCGCCVFQLGQNHKVTLHFREYVIFVRVARKGISDKTPSSKMCIEVREFITAMLFKIVGNLGQSLKFEHFIQCPECSSDSVNGLIPVSQLTENAEVECYFHDNIIESCELLKFWFKDAPKMDPVGQIYLGASDLTTPEECRVSLSRRALPPGKKYHVFFSYSSSDIQWVKKTVERLEKDHGFVCCEYERDNTPGTPLLRFANDSIRDAYKTVVVMTKEALQSGFVLHEMEMAILQGFSEKRKYVVPVLLEDCEVPGHLSVLNYVDARDPKNRDIWWPKLLTVLETQGSSSHRKRLTSNQITNI